MKRVEFWIQPETNRLKLVKYGSGRRLHRGITMAKTYIQGDHRDWAASVTQDWCDAQASARKGKMSRSDREGLESGIARTGELIALLLDKKKELTHEEWDGVLRYVWQERCD